MKNKLARCPKWPHHDEADAEDQQRSSHAFQGGLHGPSWLKSRLLLYLRRWRHSTVAGWLCRWRLRRLRRLSAGWTELSCRWDFLTASHAEHGVHFLLRNIGPVSVLLPAS